MKVNIPDKCHENWNEMTANEKGRFCQNCQKTVVDFTQMSNTQIKDHLLERQGQKLCGRFKTDQLDKDISIAPKKRLSILPKIAASALLFAGVNQFAESQVDINANKQEQHNSIEITKSQKETNRTVIYGKITDHHSNKISNVKIHFDDLQISFYARENGDFSFEIPENYDKKQVTLRFSKRGYNDVQQTYPLTQIKQGALRVLMNASKDDIEMPDITEIVVLEERISIETLARTQPMFTSGVICITPITPTKPSSLFKRKWNYAQSKVKSFCKTLINNNKFIK